MVTEKNGKKWIKGTPNNLVGQDVTQVPMKQWYIREQLGHIVCLNSYQGRYWYHLDAFLEIFPHNQLAEMYEMTSELLGKNIYKPSTKGEIAKWMGIIILIKRKKYRGYRRNMWDTV